MFRKILYLFLFFFILLQRSITAEKFFLYIFNLPMDNSLFTVEGKNIWVNEEVIQIIKKRVQIQNVENFYDKSKKMYNLVLLCQGNKDKLALSINYETRIIDVNTLRITKQTSFQNNQYSGLNEVEKNYIIKETKYFRIYYTNVQLGVLLNNLVDYYYDSISNFLEVNNDILIRDISKRKVPIYLAPTDEVYRNYGVVPDWSSGAFVYSFSNSSVAIYAHERDSFLIQRVIPHEITHLILYLYWQENVLDPRNKFLQEGIAQYSEYRLLTGLDKIVIHPEKKIPLVNLLYPYLASPEDIKDFYQNSLAFVSFLICNYGKYRFIQLVSKLKNNSDILKVLNQVYQFSLSNDENILLNEIDRQWDYFIRNQVPTPLK